MKKYLREKKRYVSVEEYEAYHAARKHGADICRGKKPHDYVLVLPPWRVSWDGVSPYDAELYYKAMEVRAEFIKKQDEQLATKGIVMRNHSYPESRHYVCSVCKKQKWG